MTKTKITIIGALGIAAIVTLIILVEQIARLREENAALQQRAQVSGKEDQPFASIPKTEYPAIDQPFDWRVLESSDYRQYMANLRAIGCPEQTIRDIISTDVRRMYRKRTAKIPSNVLNPKEYWKRETMDFLACTQAALANQQIEIEERATLIELLGPDAMRDFDVNRAHSDEQLAFLSPEQRDQLYEINWQYSQKLASSQTKFGANLMRDPTELDVEQWKKDAMSSVLSPDELKEYELRTSQHAEMLRRLHPAFDMTEDEFRKIFQIEEQFRQNLPDSHSFPLGATHLDQPFQNALKQVLGEQRFADYKMCQDPAYTVAHDVAQRLRLPTEAARSVYDLTMNGYKRGEAIFNDQTLSPDARQLALNNLKNEVQAATTQHLGEEGFKQYTARGWLASWLDAPWQKKN